MLKPIFFGALSSFQAYQIRVTFNLNDNDWKDLSFENAHINFISRNEGPYN